MKKILDLWSRFVALFAGMEFKNFRAKVDRYEEFGIGIETTWYQGLGLGFGFNKIDVWIGWPRAC